MESEWGPGSGKQVGVVQWNGTKEDNGVWDVHEPRCSGAQEAGFALVDEGSRWCAWGTGRRKRTTEGP